MGKISLFAAIMLLAVVLALLAGAGFGLYNWWLNRSQPVPATIQNQPAERVPQLQAATFISVEGDGIYFKLPSKDLGGYMNFRGNVGVLAPGAKVYLLQKDAGGSKTYVVAKPTDLKANEPIFIDIGPNPENASQPLIYSIYGN